MNCGIGIDRTQRFFPGGPVVRVAAMDAAQVTVRRRDDHPVRALAADHPGDVAAQLEADHELAVGATEELDVGDAHGGRRFALLVLPDSADSRPGHFRIVTASLTVGHDAIRHLTARFGPCGDRAGGSEVHVVGMRYDHQNSLRLFVRHGVLRW